jgi:hypothetical protein
MSACTSPAAIARLHAYLMAELPNGEPLGTICYMLPLESGILAPVTP